MGQQRLSRSTESNMGQHMLGRSTEVNMGQQRPTWGNIG